MKIIRVASILCGLLAVGSSAARATTTTYCLVSGSFSACASASFSLSPDGRTLSVTVQNRSDLGNTTYDLTAIAFFYKPAKGVGPLLTLENAPSGWLEGYGYGIQQPLKGEEWQGGVYADGESRLTGTESATFEFRVAEGFTVDLNDLQLAWRGQEWSSSEFTGESLKCYTGEFNSYSTGLAQDPTLCSSNITTVTPEPVSIVLLGTGLAGLAGVGARRRKQQLTD